MARVLIADDDPGTCDTLADILAGEGHSVTTVDSGVAALEILRRERYDVVLVDQRMPAIEGVRVVEELARRGTRSDIYVMTAYADQGFVQRALRAGARRVFIKPIDIPLLLKSMAKPAAREPSEAVTAAPGDPGSAAYGLTRREVQILRILAQGKSNQEIADALAISRRTVETHVASILARFGVSSRSAAAALAIRLHLV